MIVLHVIFWTCLAGLIHTYIVYPLLIKVLASGRSDNDITYTDRNDFPAITIVIPAHNEESVIAEKLSGLLASHYPTDKIAVLVGSDASSDSTDSIVRGFEAQYPHVRLFQFERQGKPAIVNTLVEKATTEIIVLNDANVMFEVDTLLELVKHFRNPDVALVESNMQHRSARVEGIGPQESAYLTGDAAVKRAEGLVWGLMMGPGGGCFAMRKSYYEAVPTHFLVDDFYINMKVLARGGRSIVEMKARVVEDVSNILQEEFRRKVRIAIGDFQNLAAFFPLLLRFNALSFAFFSHKVLRWIGPLLLIAIYCTAALLLFLPNRWHHPYDVVFAAAFVGMSILFMLPVVDWILKKLGIHVFGIRMLSYFVSVNTALLIGLCRFIGGVRTVGWTPTQRNQ